jgi:phenylalanine-4-hydroxylase
MAVEPVVYGSSKRPPRGDYARAHEDYTCEQQAEYSPEEHARYERLFQRLMALVPGRASDEFIAALPNLGDHSQIPRLETTSQRLMDATGWQIVAVPGLIPEVPFFTLLANKKFPVTDWLRHESEFDYVVEPDIFHDMFGHVPQMFNQTYADYMEAYGKAALRAHAIDACEQLSRLYWFTIEFGLMKAKDGVRAYGAGILSSPGELRRSVESREPNRIMLDVGRCMRTAYEIDTYQQNYFVIESFEHLRELTAPDFTSLYATAKASQVLPAGTLIASDRPVLLSQ